MVVFRWQLFLTEARMDQLQLERDEDGYPTDETIRQIADARVQSRADCIALLEAVRGVWMFAGDGYWSQEGDLYTLSTAGWSGNEDLIGALQGNGIFWGVCWQLSRRGGHHVLKLPHEGPHEAPEEPSPARPGLEPPKAGPGR